MSRKIIKKPRMDALTFEFAKPTRINAVKIDNQTVQLISDGQVQNPISLSYEKWYDRESGKKKCIFNMPRENANLNPYSIFGEYDYVVALDTNYDVNTNNQKEFINAVAAGLIFKTYSSPKDEYGVIHIQTITNDFGHRTHSVSPELLALDMIIKELQLGRWFPYSVSTKILFVVDHNMDKLDMLNAGKIPIIMGDANSYLPTNMTIMHASDKPSSDSIFNKMISECDKIAAFCRQ